MRKILFLLIGIFPVFTVGMKAGAVVTCSQPGFSQTVYNGICAVGTDTSDTLSFGASTSASIVNGTYLVQGLAEYLTTPSSNTGPYPMSATASWNDVFALPTSNSTDIFKITVASGGLNHSGSINAGPISLDGSAFCDASYTFSPACLQTATVSASNLSSIHLQGSDSVTIDGACGSGSCGLNANSNLYEFVLVERFLSDGLTSDPFTDPTTVTPEPSSLALLLFAVPAGYAFRKRS